MSVSRPVIFSVFCCTAATEVARMAGSAAAAVRSCRRFMQTPNPYSPCPRTEAQLSGIARFGQGRSVPSRRALSAAEYGPYSNGVAAVDHGPQASDAVVLEGRRGGRTIPVALRYEAIHQIRGLLSAPGGELSGTLFGAFTADGIAIEPRGERPIGFFRAQPGGWPSLTEADRKKMRSG